MVPERFRVTATLWLLTAEDGGPTQGRASGYRPNCWFGQFRDGEKLYNDCVVELVAGRDAYERDGTLWVDPGGECLATVVPAWPQFVRDHVWPGSTFDVCEGHRIIAAGLVEQVDDPGNDPEWTADRPRFTERNEAIAWAKQEATRLLAGEFSDSAIGTFETAERIESVLCNFTWGSADDLEPGLAAFIEGWNASGSDNDAQILRAAQDLTGQRHARRRPSRSPRRL